MARDLVSPDMIRAAFADAMSQMYRREVPLYGDLITIVDDVNRRVLSTRSELRAAMERGGQMSRLVAERHGAIRVGTPEELRLIKRAFAVMGMHAVDYYDLSIAGLPVHSTAFRPTDSAALKLSPFRVFVSLLRLDLIADESLRKSALAALAAREIFSSRAKTLIEIAEAEKGLTQDEADEFVTEAVQTFRWRQHATVTRQTYQRLHATHRLIADIVSFAGPHINHLTPRTLDIDLVQAEMEARAIGAKQHIEGPPARRVPILLRQTSFKAVEEPILFQDADKAQAGTHTARFGEVEQRGIALTPKGRALYDRLLDRTIKQSKHRPGDYEAILAENFSEFPDDEAELRRQKLAYFRYHRAKPGQASAQGEIAGDFEQRLAAGMIVAEPITYEDFLPVSAAGIFQSNLGADGTDNRKGSSARQAFEEALGEPVRNPFLLYDAEEQASLQTVRLATEAQT